MCRQYSLDSNIVIDVLREKVEVIDFLSTVMEPDDEIVICSIVYYEVMRGFQISNAKKKLGKFQEFYSSMKRLPLDDRAIRKSIDIYSSLHKGQQIEDNDIYIAAIAMVNDCVLVTSNTRHFSRIEGLKIIDWRK